MKLGSIPTSHTEEINRKILIVSEDQLQGFHHNPIQEIANRSGLPSKIVIERIQAMLEAGTIRRVRQTLMSTNLASGALIAWKVPPHALDAAFDFMAQHDPFSGHVVIRSTDQPSEAASYKLWTTLKIPQGFSMQRHLEVLQEKVGAETFHAMPAKGIFALGVGHARRKTLEIGAKAEVPALMQETKVVELNPLEWRVLYALKREFEPHEMDLNLWAPRAKEANVDLPTFFSIAQNLASRGLVGRFSTFLEHVKPNQEGERVTRFNALFHWAVPHGWETQAGGEVGRHLVLTHCYWREAGPQFNNVNIMAVAHSTEKETILAHKAAIDAHLTQAGIPVTYTNIFWGGRSEIKPSEIYPDAYQAWCLQQGVNSDSMRIASIHQTDIPR